MSKNNDKALLNKIDFSESFPSLGFRFSSADFHLRGEGGSIDYSSKSHLSCFLRLKNCKLTDVSLNANVKILPFEEYIKTYSEEGLSQAQEYLFKDLQWKNTPEQHWGHGYIVDTEANLSLYCTEKEFQFIQNMLLYNTNNDRLLKRTGQKLYLTTLISHPNFMDNSGRMDKAFFNPGVWYDHGVFCVDNWTMQYSD